MRKSMRSSRLAFSPIGAFFAIFPIVPSELRARVLHRSSKLSEYIARKLIPFRSYDVISVI